VISDLHLETEQNFLLEKLVNIVWLFSAGGACLLNWGIFTACQKYAFLINK
jgi:hypothetical protein